MVKVKYLLVAIIFLITNLGYSQNVDQEQLQKFQTFMRYVQLAYVDDVDSEKLTEDAIIAVLKGLDPHSVYISEKDLKK